MKACQQYWAGCTPHAHAWLHHTHGKGGLLGALMFLALIGVIWDLKHKVHR